jgi:hypothetical protein
MMLKVLMNLVLVIVLLQLMAMTISFFMLSGAFS